MRILNRLTVAGAAIEAARPLPRAGRPGDTAHEAAGAASLPAVRIVANCGVFAADHGRRRNGSTAW
ncbi:MAG: hypothetical protein U0992_01210 [Planctomycetaceae bacterium]